MTKLKTIIRPILKKPLGAFCRFLPDVRRAMKQGLTVFLFHEVSDHPSMFSKEYGLSVSRQTFYRQVSWIQANFNVIHPADILNETALPEGSAIISFDDGFLSSFENGLAILEKLNVPSVIFLNMGAILEPKPILSATACYLHRYVPEFSAFTKSIGLLPPFHLTLSPSVLESFEHYYGPVDKMAVLNYQGKFADMSVIRKWNNGDLVVYGNHLYDHWNAPALSSVEFVAQYKKNETILLQLANTVNLFSFTNGQPGTCFSVREVNLLKQLGAGKVFCAGGINRDSNKYLLGRISLGNGDWDKDFLWFRIGRAVFNDIVHNKSQNKNAA